MPTTKQKPKQMPKKTPLTNVIRLPVDALRFGLPQGLVYVAKIPGKAAGAVVGAAGAAVKRAKTVAKGMPRLLAKKSKKSKK